MGLKKVRSAPNDKTGGKGSDNKTMKPLSEGSAKGAGASEGAHTAKTQRQTQEKQTKLR